MDEKCLFKFCYNCSDNERLQVSQGDGDRLHTIMEASIVQGDDLHSELQTKLTDDPTHKEKFHKTCVSKYLITAKRSSEKQKRAASASSPLPAKRTRSSNGPPFDWLTQCFYCRGPCNVDIDPKNPMRWVPAYLVRETEQKSNEDGNGLIDTLEKRIKDKCYERADEWADDVLERITSLTVRAADLVAADARYHRECYTRFFLGRSAPCDTKKEASTDSTCNSLELLINELQGQRSQRWDSVQLMERYVVLGGNPMRRSTLINLLCERVEDLVVLSALGYRSIIFFSDNTIATLKLIKDADDDDNLEAALDVVAKHIRKECSEIEYQHRTYTTKISKDIADESASNTLQQLLSKLSLDEQSLPSLLIGNIITSVIKKHPTPLQIAIAVYLHQKKTVKHMHDYLVSCSYDELLRFKRSSAVAKYLQFCSERQRPITVEGLVQIVVDNFDAELSSPNGLVSTHDMATIETHSTPPVDPVPETIPRISKADMSNPICCEEEDKIIPYIGTEKPLPPSLPPHDLPDAYFEAQRISYERAGDMDFLFLKLITSCEEHQTPEWSGWNTSQARSQGHAPVPKTHIIYHPLIMAKPSDPSTVYTSMLNAKTITAAAGQEYTLYTADQQLFKVAVHIKWDNPQEFSDLITRLGGMHFLTNIIGCIGGLAMDSGCAEVLGAAFAGVAKMLSGKKYPQNVRALVMLTEELLRPIIAPDPAPPPEDHISSMDQLQKRLDILCTQSRTAKFWIDVIIRPILLCMKFVRAEREGDYALHIKCVAECLPLFFAAKHHQYLRYGVAYLRMMERLPDSVRQDFMKGDHTIHLRAGLWNGIWSDMAIETTWMKKGHGPEGVVGSTTNPESMKTWAYSYHDCLSLTSGLQEMRDPDNVNVQMTHKEEGKARIKSDGVDRQALRDKLAVCIDPLNTEEHQSGLINIETGEVMMNEAINVDQAYELGRKQQEEFEAGWPEAFHAPVKATVVTWTANKKAINVSGQKIVDTGIFYARALGLQASERDGVPTFCDMLATELAPVATSMFDDEGQMRTTVKSVLKKELAVERSCRGVETSAVFLDGCAVLWAVQFPAGNVTVQAYIDAFRKHIRRYQEASDVYLIFDRYISGSTKEVTRWRREKGASRVFTLKPTSRLPAQSLLFTVTPNKVQIIKMLIVDLENHKNDPVAHSIIITGPAPVPFELVGPAGDTGAGVLIHRHDLRTIQEEADTIIVQQVACHTASDKALVVVADDTDVFALLLHFRHSGSINASNVYLESPLKGRAVIDIDATVRENLSIIPGLLAAHALSGCDTVASHYGIGKGMVLKVMRAGGFEFHAFGDSSLPVEQYHKLLAEARVFILKCYRMSDCDSLNAARVKVWQNRMRRNALEPPKLCSLPPTETAFRENALRGHLAVVTWRDCLKTDPPTLAPTEHGWYHPEGSTVLLPTIVPPDTPLAPADLLKLIKCGCSSEKSCATKRCSCKTNGLGCTIFCHCRGEDDCYNK